MKLIAAYLLALLGGKPSPTPDDINSILASVGAEADDDKLDLLFSSIKGKDVEEVLALGRERFASGGGGGGGISLASGGGAGGGAAAAASAEVVKEEQKEEKKEPVEESDDDMGFSLFD